MDYEALHRSIYRRYYFYDSVVIGHVDIARSVNGDASGVAEPRADGGLGAIRGYFYDLVAAPVGHVDIARCVNGDAEGGTQSRADGGLGCGDVTYQ